MSVFIIKQLPSGRLTINVLLDALVWQHTCAIAVDLIANADIVTKNSHVLETCPATNAGVPSNDCALDPCVLLDL